VHHYELGPIALAVIKRSLPDDAELTVAGSPVTID
jgi:folate-binding Fe-S cluster repair protein YgfZ